MDILLNILIAFSVGGTICVIGQLIIDFVKLSPGHVTSYLVILGAALDTFSLYDKLIAFAGAGATVPITSFGHSLLHGALEKAEEVGFLGIGAGMFDLTAGGITATILFAYFVAIIFKPKG